jgi:hypothetical protein
LRVRRFSGTKESRELKKGRTGAVAPRAAFVFLVMLFICAGTCVCDDLNQCRVTPYRSIPCFTSWSAMWTDFATAGGINLIY